MSFRFPLQRILDLKARREEEVARQLAEARATADERRRVRDELAEAHEAGRRQLATTPGQVATVGEIRALSLMLAQYAEHLEAADAEAASADAVVDRTHAQLTIALQERRVLDRLRERRLGDFHHDEAAKDRASMDDIALTRFTRRGDGTTPSEGSGQ